MKICEFKDRCEVGKKCAMSKPHCCVIHFDRPVCVEDHREIKCIDVKKIQESIINKRSKEKC